MDAIKFKALLDTNVLLDVLCTPKRPSAEASELIFQAIRDGYLEGVVTTQSILDAAYILSRIGESFDREAFGRSILSIMNYINIHSIHFLDVRDAILHPGTELEDDALYAHADADGCDAIITSDRGFLHRDNACGILLLSPEEFSRRLRGHED